MIKKLNKEQSGFISELADNLDALGLSKISAMIIGYLIISEKEEAQFDELVSKLNVSKASVSNNLRILEKIGFVIRYRKEGQRKSFYKLGALDMREVLLNRMRSIERFTDIMKTGKKLSNPENENAERFLNNIIHFYEWVTREIPCLLETYHKADQQKTEI